MIISENKKPSLEEFRKLMQATDNKLNCEASGKEEYYKGRNGTQLEEDVYDALTQCALNTPFEGTIQLISGASFPDIVASNYYGVEVKSTNKNHWKSIGSSILESTRNQNVERIFLTFGKLGKPIEFRSRPYEECLSGISVTHYPRYQINMELKSGETIFDKMKIPYDELRNMDNPVAPVSQYYKKQLKPGESLWWATNSDIEDTYAPPTVRLWTSLSPEEKNIYKVKGYALFPEITSTNNNKKYNRYSLWLATNCGIINTCLRDNFSAGGKKDIATETVIFKNMSATFWRISKYKNLIIDTIMSENEETLKEFWNVSQIEENRILQWCHIISNMFKDSKDRKKYYTLLKAIFNI